MVKIKTKKEMKFPELIKHIADTGYKMTDYASKDNSSVVSVGSLQGISIYGFIYPREIFTVEIEEPITEDTEFETLIEVTEHQILNIRVNRSIKEIKDFNSLEFHALVNGRLTLIWTNEKGLIK